MGGRRPLRQCQKNPVHMAKETYLYGKRDLLILAYLRYAWGGGGLCVSVKRDLLVRQKSPIHIGVPEVCMGGRRPLPIDIAEDDILVERSPM